MLDLSIVTILFLGEATLRFITFIVSACCIENKFLLIHQIFFAEPHEGILSQNTLTAGRPFHCTEKTHHFQNKSPFSCLSIVRPRLRCLHLNVAERTHSSKERRHNRVGDYFRLLYLRVKKQCNVPKYLIVSLHVASVELVKQCFGMIIKRICMESGSTVVIFDRRVFGPYHEEDAFIRRIIEAWIMTVRNVNSRCASSIIAHSHKKREHTLMLAHHYTNANAAYIGGSIVGSHKL